MKHDPKLDSPKEDRCRVDLTYLQRNDPLTGEKGKITKTDDIYLTLEEGQALQEQLLKEKNNG